MFGPSLVAGLLGKGKDQPFNKHLDYPRKLANNGVFLANQLLFITVASSAPFKFQMKPAINFKTHTLKSCFTSGFQKKVKDLPAEVQAEWGDLKVMLSPVEAVGWRNRLLT